MEGYNWGHVCTFLLSFWLGIFLLVPLLFGQLVPNVYSLLIWSFPMAMRKNVFYGAGPQGGDNI
jgi:hypothetical protein